MEPNLIFVIFNSKDSERKKKEKPLTPKAVTRLYTIPPDEQRGVEYDQENCRAKWVEQSEMEDFETTRPPHNDPYIP